MTIDEYKAWIAAGGVNQPNVTHSDCRAADELIQRETLKAFHAYAKREFKSPMVRDFLSTMVRCHFGSVEVDHLLTQLGMYPEWIERAE